MGPGLRLEGWLRGSVCPFAGGVCRGHVYYFAFALSSSEVAVGFLDFFFFYRLAHNLPNCKYTVIFSPMVSLHFFAQGELCLGSSAAAKGPKSHVPPCLNFTDVETEVYGLLLAFQFLYVIGIAVGMAFLIFLVFFFGHPAA